MPTRRFRRATGFAIAAVTASAVLAPTPAAPTTKSAAGPAPTLSWSADFWGSECGDFGCADDQPRLSTPVPPAAPAGAYAGGDFDRDGVTNAADNCPIVPNAGQAPAIRPAGATEDPLAVEWKQQNPTSMFRLNSQLGEACSGWNDNWHRTEMSLKLAPDPGRAADLQVPRGRRADVRQR